MLQILRKSVSSWVGVVILGLALGALVITLFQPTGPGGSAGQGGAVLATVGKDAIHENMYRNAVDRTIANERQRIPTLTNADFLANGGGDMVLQQLISGQAMTHFANQHSMRISRRQVDGEIASIPAFQMNGQFSETTFRKLLADQRISEAELRESISGDLIRRQLLQPVLAGNSVARAMAEPYAVLMLETRSGVILPVPSLNMPEPAAPTDEQLSAFYKENSRAYTLPERRSFRYALIDTQAMAAKAVPAEAEVRAYYDANPGEFGGLESRQILQLVLPDEAKAKAFVAKVRGGTSFADAAQAEGFGASDISLSAMSQEQLATQLNADVAKAAFAQAQGVVGEPVKGSFGWHVVQVQAIQPAQPRSFASVSAEISKRMADEKRADLLASAVAQAEDKLAEGESLADVAKAVGGAVQTVPALTADGRLFDANFAATRVEQPLLPKVFDMEASEGAQVVEVEKDQFAIVEVADVMAPELVPLEKIRGDVVAAWTVKARADSAKAEAERIAAALSKGETVAVASAGKKLPPAQELTVRRLELTQMAARNQQVPPPVLMLLNTPKGQARVVAAPGGQGWFVVKVTDIKAGDPAQANQLVDAVRQSMAADTSNELAETFMRSLEREAGVVRKSQAVQAANRRLVGVVAE